jgi:hypothetical protein
VLSHACVQERLHNHSVIFLRHIHGLIIVSSCDAVSVVLAVAAKIDLFVHCNVASNAITANTGGGCCFIPIVLVVEVVADIADAVVAITIAAAFDVGTAAVGYCE